MFLNIENDFLKSDSGTFRENFLSQKIPLPQRNKTGNLLKQNTSDNRLIKMFNHISNQRNANYNELSSPPQMGKDLKAW